MARTYLGSSRSIPTLDRYRSAACGTAAGTSSGGDVARGVHRRLRPCIVALATVFALGVVVAEAATVSIGSVGTLTRSKTSTVPTAGTAAVSTHTRSVDGPIVTNGVVTTTENGAAIGSVAIPGGITVAGGLGDFFVSRNYAPAVGSGVRPKVAPYSLSQLNTSNSVLVGGPFAGTPTSSRAEASVQTLLGGAQTDISVSQRVAVNRTAAAIATDPWSFGPGTETVIDTELVAGIEIVAADDAIGFGVSGMEVFAGSTIPGLERLYVIGLGVVGATPDDLLVFVESNPLLGWDDTELAAALSTAFVPGAPGSFALGSDFALPSVHLAFASAFDVTVGAAAYGQATVVPLPAAVLSMVSALAVLGGWRLRAARQRTAAA